ncbi:hypothetical protein [Methanosarcina sp.]|uniref:hypothetical protein n=1 Tax=Methanosarcina sp. TaxID=2213 RepID=UPI003BB73265
MFDLKQRSGYFLYGWLADQFPYLYQRFFKTPFELKIKDQEYSLRNEKIHEKAREFIKMQGVDYFILGHMHNPLGDDSRLFDCGDMVDSFTYIIIENGKSRLEKVSGDSLQARSLKNFLRGQVILKRKQYKL